MRDTLDHQDSAIEFRLVAQILHDVAGVNDGRAVATEAAPDFPLGPPRTGSVLWQ